MPYGIHYYAIKGKLNEMKKWIEEELAKDSTKTTKDLIDLRGDTGATPLLLAAIDGHVEVIRYLVEQGADLRAHNKQSGSIPLHKAIDGVIRSIEEKKDAKNFYEAIEIFLEKDPSLLDVACGIGSLTTFNVAFGTASNFVAKQELLRIFKKFAPSHPKLPEVEKLIAEEQQKLKAQAEKLLTSIVAPVTILSSSPKLGIAEQGVRKRKQSPESQLLEPQKQDDDGKKKLPRRSILSFLGISSFDYQKLPITDLAPDSKQQVKSMKPKL